MSDICLEPTQSFAIQKHLLVKLKFSKKKKKIRECNVAFERGGIVYSRACAVQLCRSLFTSLEASRISDLPNDVRSCIRNDLSICALLLRKRGNREVQLSSFNLFREMSIHDTIGVIPGTHQPGKCCDP